MALTIEQHLHVYSILVAEEEKARKAVNKAEKAEESASYEYGGSVDQETAVVLLKLRLAQYQAARSAAVEYFETYINEAA